MLRATFNRLVAFIRSSRMDSDLDREVAAHLALLEDNFVRRGLTRDQARVAARRALGGVDQTKERHRDARSFVWLEDLRRDVPYALRGLRRAPGFTAAAVVTLALGIGATTAVFTVVDTILLAPLPYPDSDRLVRLIELIPSQQAGRPPSRRGIGRDELLEWQTRTQTLVGMAKAYWTPHRCHQGSGYLGSIGVRLLAGRTLDQRDDANAPPVVLVSQSVARQYFADASPVGATMAWHNRNVSPVQVEIVGVVDDVRQGHLDQEATPQIFVEYRQMLALQQRWGASTMAQEALALGFMSFAVRAMGDPAALAPAVASTIKSLDPNAGIDAIAPMDRLVASSIARPRFYAVVLSIFAGIAGLLAAVGVYGVLAYAVVQRTQEIGVRMALGAQRAQVLRMVLRRGIVLTTIGIVLGVAAAAGLTRYLTGMLYGLTPLDATTYVAVAVGFALVALIASYLPARRATKVDPMVALRCE